MKFAELWKSEAFWVNVAAGLFVCVVWFVGGRVLQPLWNWIALRYWPGMLEWLHDLGWLAFLLTLALWFVNSRLLRSGHMAVGHTLPVPNRSQRAGAVNPLAGGLMIHSAEYGLEGHNIDVTDDLRRCVKNGRIDVVVKNHLWGGRDPIIGQRKRLRVVYSVQGGSRMTLETTEKDRLSIP